MTSVFPWRIQFFLALMRWAEVNDTYREALKPLLDLVRFKAMTINYLHDIVTSHHPIALTVPGFPQMFEEAVFFHAFSKVCFFKACYLEFENFV